MKVSPSTVLSSSMLSLPLKSPNLPSFSVVVTVLVIEIFLLKILILTLGNYGMCGRAYSPRFLYTWPGSKTAVMGGDQAAGVLTQIKREATRKVDGQWNQQIEDDMMNKYKGLYEAQSTSYYSTARLWDDGIILPSDTRKVLGKKILFENLRLIMNNRFEFDGFFE